MRTARLRLTNEVDDICSVGQLTFFDSTRSDSEQKLTVLAHHRAVGDMTLRLRPHVLLSLRGAIKSKHAAGISIMT